jgi:hypothetical protein
MRCMVVIPAKAGLRRQDAEANIRRKANGPQGSSQERAVIHFDLRAYRNVPQNGSRLSPG